MAILASHTALPGSSDTNHVQHHQGAQRNVLSASIVVGGRTGCEMYGKGKEHSQLQILGVPTEVWQLPLL